MGRNVSLRHCWAELGLSVPTVTCAHVWHWPCHVGRSGRPAPGSRAACSRCSLNPVRPPRGRKRLTSFLCTRVSGDVLSDTEGRTGGDSTPTMLEETTVRAASHGSPMCQGRVYGPPRTPRFPSPFPGFLLFLGSRVISARVRRADRHGGVSEITGHCGLP